MLSIIISLILACAIHEAGHYFVARYYGEKLVFNFTYTMLFDTIPIPRFIWDMPESLTDRQQKIVALAGFVFEIVSIPIIFALGITAYPTIVMIHICMYLLYAREYNDFSFLSSNKRDD